MSQSLSNEEIGIVQVYRTKNSTNRRGHLPLLFKVRLKKDAELVFMNYRIARENHPYLLIDLFERLATVKEEKDNDYFQETSQELCEKQQIVQTEPIIKTQSKKSSHHLREIAALRQFNESPPLRKLRKETCLRQSQQKQERVIQDNNRDQSAILAADSVEGERSQQTEQPSIVTKKILDYDLLVGELGMLNLITPAIFPKVMSKLSVKMEKPKLVCAPAFSAETNFKLFEREGFSDEEFRESESEFLLDENGRERRRKERLQREQAMRSKQRLIKKKRKKVTRLI